MINNVVGINGGAPIQNAQVAIPAAPTPETPARVPRESFTSSRIRVDNFLDLAILEVRSQETGDIIRQYPTERQIEAFQRAAELDSRRSDAAENSANNAPSVSSTTQQANNAVGSNISVDISSSSTSNTASSAGTSSASGNAGGNAVAQSVLV